MDVYVMQHGEAVPAEVDPDRPLADAGRASVSAVATHVAACGVRVDRIVHSGKLRAAQTAELLAAALGTRAVDEVSGLKPNDLVQAAAAALIAPGAVGSLALVGHLPFLDRFASLLVTGDVEAHVVALRNGGLVKLVPSRTRSGYSVAWVITPEVVRR